MEEAFENLPGVKKTRVGYMGGSVKCPISLTASNWCVSKGCGVKEHVETVQVEWDSTTNFAAILDAFFDMHTASHDQDWGPYANALFYHGEEQKKVLDEVVGAWEKKSGHKMETFLIDQQKEKIRFWKAAEYHQKFNEKRRRGFSELEACCFPL